jgi:hypothetical protein
VIGTAEVLGKLAPDAPRRVTGAQTFAPKPMAAE